MNKESAKKRLVSLFMDFAKRTDANPLWYQCEISTIINQIEPEEVEEVDEITNAAIALKPCLIWPHANDERINRLMSFASAIQAETLRAVRDAWKERIRSANCTRFELELDKAIEALK